MKRESYIVYIGQAFTIEFYFDANDNCQAYEYFVNMSDFQKKSVFTLLQRMGDVGKIYDKTKFRHEGDQIYAFKPMPDRFLSFFTKGKKIIITNAFSKKQDKLPLKEKKKALEKRKDYLKRTKEDTYYEKA